MRAAGVNAVFHYVPLHSSPAGRQFGRVHGSLAVTDRVGEQLLRLPLWIGLTAEAQEDVVRHLRDTLG